MSHAPDLRQKAARLRDQLPPRQTATPPQETGRRIGTVPRSPTEEIRVNWATYEGRPFVSIRQWNQDQNGQWWPDGKRGISIRLRELPELALAIGEALDLAVDAMTEYPDRDRRRAQAQSQDRNRDRDWERMPPPRTSEEPLNEGSPHETDDKARVNVR